jgi:hypothetical protein
MGVWEIMNIDKSLRALKETPKKSIDPEVDRSLPNNDFLLNQTERANSRIDNPDPITQPCRDCPEGMQW